MIHDFTLNSISAAAETLHSIAHRTPCITSRTLDRITGKRVVLKCENFQRAGAFKFRGAYNALSRLSLEQRQQGVIAFSSGNHAQGVALAAQLLGIPAVICMPDDAPAVKRAATEAYGAEIQIYNRLTDDREAFTRAIAEQRGLALIPPYDHPDIIAGAGTAAYELLQDYPEIDTLLVPIGGGGLISGSAIAAHGLRPDLTVYGVEPHDADDTARSLRQGQRVHIAPPQTIADGLRITMPGALTFPIIQQHVHDVLLVDDRMIKAAIRFALLRLKLVIEPSAAVVLAALLEGVVPSNSQVVGAIISGGNLDPALLVQLW